MLHGLKDTFSFTIDLNTGLLPCGLITPSEMKPQIMDYADLPVLEAKR